MAASQETEGPIQGKIIEAEVSITQDAIHPLPLACGLYAVENKEGVWLCAYYGSNRSNFDTLPKKDQEIDEARLGLDFETRQFVPRDRYKPETWEKFKKTHLSIYALR